MNKRQKLVQQQFLDNEEAVIKRLKTVYNKSLDDITKKSQELHNQINALDKAMESIEDAEELARLKSMKQSKVYQKQYQDALKKQVGSVLDNMQVEEFKTVSEYLNKCYEEGFMGTMFDLHGQGIPLCFPIDQEAMVRAVQLDSKISKGLYSRLGEDVGLLKRKIMAQVSRGISTGMSFEQVAQQLSAYTNIGFNNAVRIARTEGHRIQVQSGMDACFKAKEKGADVVKQWDATLDSSTRESHQKVDGEVRELDKPFSNGLMFPGDTSGLPAEVINCRCALLQRAKWALDEDELQTLKDRAAYYGLDKADSFDEYKKKYLKAAEEVDDSKTAETTKSFDPYSFTDEESEAIEYYVSGDGQYINQYYRGNVDGYFGELSEDEKNFAKRLDEATDRVLPDDIDKLYRSVDASAVFGDMTSDDWYNLEQYINYGGDSFGKGAYADRIRQNAQNTLNKTKGKTITEKGFMSTTKKLDVAEDWGSFTGSNMPVTLEFDDIPKGLKGADLKMFDIEGDEQFEVLLARKTKYKITDIYAKNGQVHIKASFIIDDVADTVDDIQDAAKVIKKQKFVPATTKTDAVDYAKRFNVDADYSKYNIDVANAVNETLSKVEDVFGTKSLEQVHRIGTFPKGHSTRWQGAYVKATDSDIDGSLWLRNVSKKDALEKLESVAKENFDIGHWSTPEALHTVRHELGHAVHRALETPEINAELTSLRKSIVDERIKRHRQGDHNHKYSDWLSDYGMTNTSEFVAESVAEYLAGNPRETAIKVVEILKRGV